ncbi:MAG: HAD family phosphatase [Tyzzerella sp.]|nr:HAD family phosphatase [Tyzzerella sp.]
MRYEMLVLDLDGTLTNSEKKITPPTREALIEIQKAGKKVVLASGRPTPGITPLADILKLDEFGSYILAFNGARIINCRTGEIIYDKTFPNNAIPEVIGITKQFDVNVITYTDKEILSNSKPNQYTEIESRITGMPIVPVDDFVKAIDFPINKLLVTGEPASIGRIENLLKKKFNKFLGIYQSQPFFLEVVPQNIDKAQSLQKLLNSIGLTADQMICCGDGHNDLSMIEYAGLGVAMANAEPLVKEKADYITKSNDEDGVLYVINQFMRD